MSSSQPDAVESLDELRVSVERKDTLGRIESVARAALVGSVVAAVVVGALLGLVWVLPVPITAGPPVVALAFIISWALAAVLMTAIVATR